MKKKKKIETRQIYLTHCFQYCFSSWVKMRLTVFHEKLDFLSKMKQMWKHFETQQWAELLVKRAVRKLCAPNKIQHVIPIRRNDKTIVFQKLWEQNFFIQKFYRFNSENCFSSDHFNKAAGAWLAFFRRKLTMLQFHLELAHQNTICSIHSQWVLWEHTNRLTKNYIRHDEHKTHRRTSCWGRHFW